MAYEEKAFLKTKNGIKAPEGFHYMPSGRLMSDADHIARYGYIEKKIKSVKVDYEDIPPGGGSKTIAISGDEGFIASIEVYQGDRASYYNFKTKTWGLTPYKQTNIQGISGSYSIDLDFPAQVSLKTFTINVYAETVENIKTKHTGISEARNADGSLNVNASTGSDSNVITKVLYQDVIKNLYLSATSPSLFGSSTATTNGAVSSNRMILDQDATDPNIVQVGDLISCTGIASTLGVLVTKINPDGNNIHEIEMSAADVVSDGVTVNFKQGSNGMTPNHISSTTGRAALEVASGSSVSLPFLITLLTPAGRGFVTARIPTAEDLIYINELTFGASPILIPGENIYPTATAAFTGDDVNGAVTGGLTIDTDATDISDNIKFGDKITTPVTTDTVNGNFSGTLAITMDSAVATKMAVGDQVTGTTALDSGIFTVASLDSTNVFSLSANWSAERAEGDKQIGVLNDGATLTFSSKTNRSLTTVGIFPTDASVFAHVGIDGIPVQFRDNAPLTFFSQKNSRWPVLNIANLANGMVLDPGRSGTGLNTTTPAIIDDYNVDKTLQRIDESNRYYTDFENYTEQDVYVGGVDPAGNAVTAIDRNGRITAQAGNITFNVQQAEALKSDADVLIIAQGAEAIQQATGMQVSVSGVTITPTQVFTTTTAASSSSTTIALTEVGNIIVGQTVRGVGVNSAVASPTVVSKSVATGAGNIVVSSAQTIEDEATLFFDGSNNELLIRGRVSIKNMPISDTTLYFNVEGFLGVA